jgi:hypothetical protein
VVFIKVAKTNWVCLFIPVIPATREAEVGGSQSEAGLSRISRPCLKNKLRVEGLERGSSGRVPAQQA